MTDYGVTVVEYPTKSLAGLKVRTNLKQAPADCPALWQAFGSRLSQIPLKGARSSFGICVMLNQEDFDYWAAIELEPGLAAENDLESIDLSAGPYAKAKVDSLEKLGSAYMYLYDQWPKSRSDYLVNFEMPCFELYPPDWQITQPFEVYAPLTKI